MSARRLRSSSVPILLACMAWPARGRTQESPLVANPDRAEATVIRIDGEALIVDVVGASPEARFRVYRPLSVRHPVTGRTLRDRFFIGRVRVATAGAVLSAARAEGELERPPAVGDILVPELAEAAPSSPRPGPPPAPAAAGAAALPPIVSAGPAAPRGPSAPAGGAPPPVSTPGATPAERAVLAAWLGTLGQPPQARIVRLRDFLAANPGTPYRAALQREILTFGALVASEPGRPSSPSIAPPPVGGPASPALAAHPARSLRPNDPAVVAFQLAAASPGAPRPRTALLHVRRMDEPTYRQIVMTVEGDGYFRTRIPSRFVRAPGFAYFVEVLDPGERALPVLWSAEAPLTVTVAEVPAPARGTAGRSRVDLRTEYADVGSGTFHGIYRPEWFLLVEGDFLQRLRWSALYGYRVGFGVYSGTGQSLAAYEEEGPDAEAPRDGTVVYGYHELELELTALVHAMLRVEVGMHEQGLVGGGQGRLRIGDEQKTNIVVGGDILDEVGQKAFFAFTFFPTQRLPVLAQGEVFNQEIDGGDPMFRLVSQVGYRFERWAALALRGSYQLRNIHHGGFGGGVALTLDW